MRLQKGPGWEYVLQIAAARRAIAYSWPIIPPIEVPTRWKRSRPSASTSPCRSSAICAVVYGPGGADEPPSPRLS